jgi:SAM-dependent methyltransferase
MDRIELANKLDQFKWYHRIKVADEVFTPGIAGAYQAMWDFNLRALSGVDFQDKKVLDVGCRDGLFSFEAERRGAREVVGIDNDLSPGATDFLIPFFNSKVKMFEMNLLDITPERFGAFDIILLFGVLYHLRYPIWGLKKLVDCLSESGLLLIETGMMVDSRYETVDFIYCPVDDSPYEPTSCTFFNRKGLDTTMRSLGCEALDCKTLGKDFVQQNDASLVQAVKANLRKFRRVRRPRVNRQFFTYRKNISVKDEILVDYWDGTHVIHSENKKA